MVTSMTPNPTSGHYDRLTIGLHWVVAASVALLWPLGLITDDLPKGPIRDNVWSVHFVLGFLFALALAALIGQRLTRGRQLSVTESAPFHRLAKATHIALYVLAICVIGLGVANALVRGVGLFGLIKLPQLGDREWRHVLTDIHGVASHLLMAVAFFHASAALVHHFYWHDHVLRRMLPRAR